MQPRGNHFHISLNVSSLLYLFSLAHEPRHIQAENVDNNASTVNIPESSVVATALGPMVTIPIFEYNISDSSMTHYELATVYNSLCLTQLDAGCYYVQQQQLSRCPDVHQKMSCHAVFDDNDSLEPYRNMYPFCICGMTLFLHMQKVKRKNWLEFGSPSWEPLDTRIYTPHSHIDTQEDISWQSMSTILLRLCYSQNICA